MLSQKNNKQFNRWYYPAVILIVAAAGVISTAYVYFKVDSAIKVSLLQRVGTMASALDCGDIANLAGDQSDLGKQSYISLKQRLQEIRAINSDVRFVKIRSII